MPKSSKRFVISDSSQVNSYGFRTLTDGIDLAQFKRNPLFLFMHQRPKGLTKDEVLPIGRMEDIELADGKLYGTPFFDDKDEHAMKLYDKVEAGVLRMMSPGLLPIEWSKEPGDMLAGQKLPTLVKSKLREVSLVDIGSDDAALALYDDNDNVINLAAGGVIDFFKIKTQNKMEELKEVAGLLQLNAADPNLVTLLTGKVKEVQEQLVTLQAQNATLVTEKETAVNELATLKADAAKAQVISLVDGAVTAKKITAVERDSFIKLATADFETTKTILDGMKGHTPLAGIVTLGAGDANSIELEGLMKLTAKELYMTGKFERLKTLSAAHYDVKYAEFLKKEN